jgi:2-succinyl-5-enolpyruvyl-6-hydroxy-3-cyclohexene-1-carboxylate synthase
VAAEVVAAMRPGENLVFGASSSVRYADVAPVNPTPGTCWANRGLAGIDGTVSTATGIALATGAPTTVLLGDLTFQHDLGALIFPRHEPEVCLRVILLDDQGGTIFASLEPGQPVFAAAFDRVFRVSQGVELGSVARSMGWRTAEVTCIQSLRQILAKPSSGRELLHIDTGRD